LAFGHTGLPIKGWSRAFSIQTDCGRYPARTCCKFRRIFLTFQKFFLTSTLSRCANVSRCTSARPVSRWVSIP